LVKEARIGLLGIELISIAELFQAFSQDEFSGICNHYENW